MFLYNPHHLAQAYQKTRLHHLRQLMEDLMSEHQQEPVLTTTKSRYGIANYTLMQSTSHTASLCYKSNS